MIPSASGMELARQIRSGERSSRDIVEQHIARILAVNPSINAVVVDRFEAARAEADRADQAVAEGIELPPLHGVPCTIKESFAVQGMPWTGGLLARRGTRAPRDATTVARLRAAGAIVLGLTNLSELCMWFESDNPVYGRTGNPYDPQRICGGSSGGEGAIVGAGGSPFGLGADVGGSIRMPAFFCGVFGHKGGSGVVPNTGQFPIASQAASGFLSSGPIARRAEDLMPLMRILAGPDGHDAASEVPPPGDATSVSFVGRPVVRVARGYPMRVEACLQACVDEAAAHLESLGGQGRTIDAPLFRRSFEMWSAGLTAAEGHGRFLRLMQRRRRRDVIPSFLRRGEHTLPAAMLAVLEDVGAAGQGRVQRNLDRIDSLRAQLLDAMGDGVLLFPSHPRRAPAHRATWLRPLDFVFTGVFNVLGLPVTQVPMGLVDGLPVGVQVVGAPGADHVTIAAALALEARFGGWSPPPY